MLYRDKRGRLRNDSRPRWNEPELPVHGGWHSETGKPISMTAAQRSALSNRALAFLNTFHKTTTDWQTDTTYNLRRPK